VSRDDAVLTNIDAAFGAVERPAQFHPDLSDPEASEHEELLRSRDRETLSLADVGNAGWDPIFDALPHGIAYFFPRLARLALATPPNPWDWYAPQLLFHLSYKSRENAFYKYCNPPQRAAVADLLAHVIETRADLLREREASDEFMECLALWRSRSRCGGG
jgi:hypothetical protein